MRDIEEVLQTMDIENIKIPLNIETKIQYALSNFDCKRKENGIKKIIKTLVGIIIAMVSTSGICFATVQIYNEYIKKQDAIETRGLFDLGDGISNFDTDLRQNDMIWDEENGVYYKVISDFSTYEKYKERVNSLPEIIREEFKNQFLFIVTWTTERQMHEMDLEVSRVMSDNLTTYITLKQKKEADYNTENNMIYAVISNNELKSNVKLEIEHYNASVPGYKNIEELPCDYSLEEAINDKCFTVFNKTVMSNNPNGIDEFIKKSESGENCYIRIYRKVEHSLMNGTYIYDIEYKDGIYYMKVKNIANLNEKESFYSYEKLLKCNGIFGNEYHGVMRKKDMEDGDYITNPFICLEEVKE